MFAAIQKASGARVALTNSAYNYATKLGAIKSFLSDPIGGGGGGGVTDWPDIPWFVVDEALSSCPLSVASTWGKWPSAGSCIASGVASGVASGHQASQPMAFPYVTLAHDSLPSSASPLVSLRNFEV